MATIEAFTDIQQVREAIEKHERQTAFKYIADDYFGKHFEDDEVPTNGRIHWQISTRREFGLALKFDGIPFIFMGKKTYICHYGRDKGLAMKRKYRENKERRMRENLVCPKSRCLKQPTKKMGCPAMIEIKKIAKFPAFKLSSTTRTAKQRMVEKLKKALEDTASPPKTEIKYLVHIPSAAEHKFHPIAATTVKSTKRRRIKKVHEALERMAVPPPAADIKYVVYIPAKDEHHFHQAASISSEGHSSEITIQHRAQGDGCDNGELAEEFVVELGPADASALSCSRFESLMVTARSTLQDMIELTYKFRDAGNFDELSKWVETLGHSLHQAQTFVTRSPSMMLCSTSTCSPLAKNEGGLILESSAMSAPPTKREDAMILEPSTGDVPPKTHSMPS